MPCEGAVDILVDMRVIPKLAGKIKKKTIFVKIDGMKNYSAVYNITINK